MSSGHAFAMSFVASRRPPMTTSFGISASGMSKDSPLRTSPTSSQTHHFPNSGALDQRTLSNERHGQRQEPTWVGRKAAHECVAGRLYQRLLDDGIRNLGGSMLLIEFSFPAGRYHATAWGRHVNEGVPEWPPSPYRLVRALYDAWKRKRPDWEHSRVERVLNAISASHPSYRLPPATVSDTRSF